MQAAVVWAPWWGHFDQCRHSGWLFLELFLILTGSEFILVWSCLKWSSFSKRSLFGPSIKQRENLCYISLPMLCHGVLSFRVSGRQWSVEDTWPGFCLRVRRLLGQIQKYLIKLLFRKRDNPR